MNNIQKALLVFGVGFLIFLIIKPKLKKNDSGSDLEPASDTAGATRKKIPMPKANPDEMAKNSKSEDARICLCAWIDAYNGGMTADKLDELNMEMNKQYGLNVLCEGTELNGFTMVVNDGTNDIIRYKTNN